MCVTKCGNNATNMSEWRAVNTFIVLDLAVVFVYYESVVRRSPSNYYVKMWHKPNCQQQKRPQQQQWMATSYIVIVQFDVVCCVVF